jgi:aspartate oxidase
MALIEAQIREDLKQKIAGNITASSIIAILEMVIAKEHTKEEGDKYARGQVARALEISDEILTLVTNTIEAGKIAA